MSEESLHPVILLFQEMAVMLDETDNEDGLDEAVSKLAAWIDLAAPKLNEDDLDVLSGVGAIVYREGLRRRADQEK
jgi:hypothetical protein